MNKEPNFIFKWLAKKLQHVYDHDDNSIARDTSQMVQYKQSNRIIGVEAGLGLESQLHSPKTSITFRVHIASGGKIIETNMYNAQKDNSNQGLYIVTEDQQLGQEIEKIITMELLK